MPKAVDFSTGQTWWRCLANPMSRLISWVPIILTKKLSSTSFSTISFIFSTSSLDLFSTNWPYLKSCYSNWDMKMIVIFSAIKKIQTLCKPQKLLGNFLHHSVIRGCVTRSLPKVPRRHTTTIIHDISKCFRNQEDYYLHTKYCI